MFDILKDYLLKRLIPVVLWVTDDPSSFFVTLLLFITPFLLLTVVLSWKLRKAIKTVFPELMLNSPDFKGLPIKNTIRRKETWKVTEKQFATQEERMNKL
uniref:Small integral membrane protein 15 n=1 Tax=Onchocerca volvulus TaxID=6282 RepID=A0A8R1Y9Q3_ONCVO